MKRIDYFFDKQPPLSFVETIRDPLHIKKPKWFGRTQPQKGEVCAQGAYLVNKFPDAENLLETATEDFSLFLNLYEIAGNRYPIRLVQQETSCFEAFRICVEHGSCQIDTPRKAISIVRAVLSTQEHKIGLSCGKGHFVILHRTETFCAIYMS